jgi:hypothetical protein
LVGRQVDLRLRDPATLEHARHRDPEPASQIVCLIEPTVPPSARMKGYRHYDISVAQDLSAVLPHQCRERWSDRATAVILEGVNDVP